jgi:hypothetical protein
MKANADEVTSQISEMRYKKPALSMEELLKKHIKIAPEKIK